MLLAASVRCSATQGWHTVNLDITIACEEPRIGPHVPAMREAIAQVLETTPDRGLGQGDHDRETRFLRPR